MLHIPDKQVKGVDISDLYSIVLENFVYLVIIDFYEKVLKNFIYRLIELMLLLFSVEDVDVGCFVTVNENKSIGISAYFGQYTIGHQRGIEGIVKLYRHRSPFI